MIYTAIFLIFLLVWLVVAKILFTIFYKQSAIDKLKYYDDNYIIKEKLEDSKKAKVSIFKVLSGFIPSQRLDKKKNQRLESELMKADIPITVEELLVIKILTSSAICFLIYALFKNIIIMVLAFFIAWCIPKYVIKRRKKERMKQFDFQLSEGIMIISNSLKAGYSFLQAVSVVVEETKEPFSKEFRKLLKEMTLGVSEEEALKNLQERMESDDLRLITNAILIQKDIGGNLSEILDNILETIRERQRIHNEIKTLTAQGRLSGIIVMIIPIFLCLIIYLFNKEYMMLLFTTPLGLAMVVMSIFNQILAVVMIRKIVNINI